MIETTTLKPIFARHETFHPRFGWLKKGFDKNDVFSTKKSDATTVLGVGKNMVNSIRYWSVAFKILEQDSNASRNAYKRSEFGIKLFSDDGWDPYLEDSASLWLLHWVLLSPPCFATAWHFVFNEFNQLSFTVDDLLHSLKEYKSRVFPNKKITDASLGKDINCLLRMYVEGVAGRQKGTDTISCPFTDLGIIGAFSDSKRFIFNFENKPTLPDEIIVAACLDFASRADSNAKTISVSRLLYDQGSPGQLFKIIERNLCGSIENISKKFKWVSLSDTAGMIQLSFRKDPSVLAEKLIEGYYQKRK